MSNLVGLCVPHHADVTGGVGGHAARIDHGEGVWWWIEIRSVGDAMVNHVIGPLVQQPLVVEGDPSNLTEARSHSSLAPGETCPSCGYTKPAARVPGPRRAAGSWTVAVPQDAELGAEVLDDWVKDFAALLGLDPASPRLLRYHVLTTVLAWAAQNQAQFVYDVRESRLA